MLERIGGWIDGAIVRNTGDVRVPSRIATHANRFEAVDEPIATWLPAVDSLQYYP
jgi:hypothetical protein